ncbi:hypothetical protein EDB80DRAFT_693462 [Ilyonectria destructans]|nr:hypothetical protein EDB80DRAFT_693462 [Ilyonectria destructans]
MHSIDDESIGSLLRLYCTVHTLYGIGFLLRKRPSAMTGGKRTSKCKASRENDNTVSVEAWYDPTHGRLGGTIWVPEGESIPDMNALTRQLWTAEQQVAIKKTQAEAEPKDQCRLKRRFRRRDKAMTRARIVLYIGRCMSTPILEHRDDQHHKCRTVGQPPDTDAE